MRRLSLELASGRTASVLIVAARPLSFFQKVKTLTTESKMANSYKPDKFRAKDLTQGPQAGVGFDPVYNNYVANRTTGPLRRKSGSSAEDFLDVEEVAMWMEVRHAAKILDIKEDDLATLTKARLEHKWHLMYKKAGVGKQDEVLIATEVLLEYIDSSLKTKKSKQYYKAFLQKARLSVDDELQKQKSDNRQWMMYSLAFLFCGACVSIMAVAYFRNFVGHADAELIGTKAADYVTMTFMQNNNVEDAPDYSTRYFHTPTAMEADRRAGRADTAFLDSEEVRVLQGREEYDRREEAEMLQILNEANETEARRAHADGARGSRVSVYRPEDLAPATDAASARSSSSTDGSSRGGDGKKHKTSYADLSYGDFSNMMSAGFGGGSRFNRLTSDTTARAEELRRLKARREAEEGGGKEEATSD